MWPKLREHGIVYSMTTKGVEPTMLRGFHANMAAGVTPGAARYEDVTRPMNLIYTIYVRNKDFEQAKRLLSYGP